MPLTREALKVSDETSSKPSAADSGSKAQLARRRFLKNIGVLAATSSLAPVVLALKSSPATANSVHNGADGSKRWGLFIDSSKCASGCDACVRGCNEEHGLKSTEGPDTDAQWIRKVDLEDKLTGAKSSLPVMCQHCDTAPCVDVCPTGASFKRTDGIVLVNAHTCIGCRYCMMACPYKARSFVHENLTEQKPLAPRGKGTVESCTLCVHRVDAGQGQQPACAVSCADEAHSAIIFGDLNDPGSDISKAIVEKGARQIRSELQLNTGVRYSTL